MKTDIAATDYGKTLSNINRGTIMCDYGNEINELIAEGWSYEEAAGWCEFVGD